jgi:Ran GTPase-activating protein (RanGAP) involved in mRNA processing and transport
MGNAYGEAFGESFALMPNIESINLSNNRMNDLTVSKIVHHASTNHGMLWNLQHLNLSYNPLGIQTTKALCLLLTHTKKLLTLNLSHCQLKDPEIVLLSETLQKLHQPSLLRLFLNENHFSLQGVLGLAKFLEQNTKIEEFYLSWNKIRGFGAMKLVEAIKFHPSLRALDLSWNSLDSNDPPQPLKNNTNHDHTPMTIVSTLADAIANNKILSHLDLSNNRLNEKDCQILAKALEENQTLIGLHMAGNVGMMDSRGFLIVKQKETSLQDQHRLMSSISVFEEYHSDTVAGNDTNNPTNNSTTSTGSFPDHLSLLVDNTCWYCGQYTE